MYLDSSLLINQQKLEGIEKDITCPICQGIINDPYFCNNCQNNFCKNCINKWQLNNPKCPFRCINPEYINNRFLNKILNELIKFKCPKNCDEIISYKDVNTHYEYCKNEDFKEKYYENATQVEILKVQIENYKDIENELDEVKERNNELENELEEIEGNKNKLEYEIYEIKEINENLENEIENVRDENYELEKENENLTMQNKELSKQIESVKEKNIELISEINKKDNEKNELQNNINNLNGRINEYQMTIEKLNGEKMNLKKEIKRLNEIINSKENN